MVHVNTAAIRRLASDFDTEVAATLAAARTALEGAQGIEYSNFTAVHVPLAVAYVEAWNFHSRDLQSKAEFATTVAANLKVDADTWDEADRASTVREEPG
jgi:hypothetical protein